MPTQNDKEKTAFLLGEISADIKTIKDDIHGLEPRVRALESFRSRAKGIAAAVVLFWTASLAAATKLIG
jgi:hypothetical protein